jgi:DNA-binding transcriptional MocR family regulator
MSEYLPQEKFADRMESLYVGMCVALGHMERRPFSVSKLAAYLEAPRTTVLRQLDHLVERGVIARRGAPLLHERGAREPAERYEGARSPHAAGPADRRAGVRDEHFPRGLDFSILLTKMGTFLVATE